MNSRLGTLGTIDGQLTNTIAAIFATTHDAREGIKQLHKAGFHKTWLGITKPADRETGAAIVEDTQGLSRFLSPTRLPLHKALLEHGISEDQASEIEESIAPGCSVVTVYGEDNPRKAFDLLSDAKGQVIDGQTPQAAIIAGISPRTGVDKDDRNASGAMRDDVTRVGDRDDDEFAGEEFIATYRA